MPIQFDPFVASQGLAAGLAGKLPEFQQSQNQKRQLDLQVEAQVQESQFKDAYVAQQLLANEDYDGIVKLGITRLTMLQGLNANPAETQRVLQVAIAARNGDPEARRLLKGELDSAVNVGMATGVLQAPEKQDPMILSEGQTAFDSAGNIIAQGKEKAVKRETAENALGQRVYIDDGSIVPGFEATTPSGSVSVDQTAAKTENYLNGTTRQQFQSGRIAYIGADGKEVTGDENISKFNAAAREAGLNDPATIAANIANAKAASVQSTKAYETVNKVRSIIPVYDQAISAIQDSFAYTSPVGILNKFPTVTNAGADLDSARIALGLGVIQMTTFGALSRGELDLAMESGVPKGDRDQVVTRLQERRAAQIKYADALEEAAIYLGTSGNTIAGYIQMQRDKQASSVPATSGRFTVEEVD